MRRPYRETRNGRSITRVFEGNIDSTELKWHRDASDRYVTVLKSSNWSLQLENSLPINLIEGISYFIEKDEWHRVIKGSGPLVLRITEY